MRKFSAIYKEKLNESENQREAKILSDFEAVYSAMLEHYNLKSIKHLNEESQTSFLTELNRYWIEEYGLTEKGKAFLEKGSMELNESSTISQRKNYLKTKSLIVINETIRQSNLRNRLYDVIDEMYTQLGADTLRDVLTPESMVNIIRENLNISLSEFTSKINTELTESYKHKK